MTYRVRRHAWARRSAGPISCYLRELAETARRGLATLDQVVPAGRLEQHAIGDKLPVRPEE